MITFDMSEDKGNCSMERRLVRNAILVFLGVLIIFASGCTDNSDSENAPVQETTNEEMTNATGNVDEGLADNYNSTIDPDNFVEGIDNPYFPLTPGTTFFYEGRAVMANINVERYITNQTKDVMGVTTTVVRDRELIDGELVEEAYGWYAQDRDGNVWYFGKDAKEYEGGEVVDTEGSWEAGVDGAQPGIIMLNDPQPGLAYREEYYEGEAEDMAEVLSLSENVTVPYGSFENSLMIKEWTPLESEFEVNKYYAMDVGMLKEISVEGEGVVLELVNITTE